MALLQGNQGQTGKQTGQNLTAGFGESSDLLVTELQARFYQQNYRGNLFAGGMQLTSISNATFSLATALSATLATAATATPIVGIWNPSTSGVNAVILQAIVESIITALQMTGPGGYGWAVFLGQVATITTGLIPINRKSFASAGSQVKNLAGVALTGLQNIGAFLGASGLGNPALNLSTLQTAAGLMPSNGQPVENIDGSIIVPPGGILALFATGTPVAISCLASLLWEEVPV
jgi:hypothetical protein